MSQKKPFNVKQMIKDGLFDDKRFYQLLSENCGYISPDMAKRFYSGLVRLVTQEIKKNGAVRLPHLGDVALIVEKARPRLMGHKQVMVEDMKILKFYANESWREYFNNL